MSGPVLLFLRLALGVSLYAFLGWALWTLWRDLRTQGQNLSTRKVPPIHLLVQTASGPSTLRSFAVPEITLGRDPACELTLPDETISVRHARLRYHHGQWWLEDLGSTNGTRLNRSRVVTPTVVTSGDRIECGESILSVSLAGEELSRTIPVPPQRSAHE